MSQAGPKNPKIGCLPVPDISAYQASVQSCRAVVVAVVLQLLGEVEELLPLRIDMQLAVNDPALVGAVLDRVPDVAVAGYDAVAFRLQLRGRVEEFIPARSDFVLDRGRIVRAEYVLGDRAAIDEGASGRLVSESLSAGRPCCRYRPNIGRCRRPSPC